MMHDPEIERLRRELRREQWFKVKGLAFLVGLCTASTFIVLGIFGLMYWVIRGIL